MQDTNKWTLFPNGIENQFVFSLFKQKMKIEITFVFGDSLLNIKQDTAIYFANKILFCSRKKASFYFWGSEKKTQHFSLLFFLVSKDFRARAKQTINNT